MRVTVVLNTASKELCGMVIAASDRGSLAYIVSAERMLGDIAKRGWSLLSIDDAYMESGESYDQEVDAQTTQSTQALLPVTETSQAESSSKNIPQATSLSAEVTNSNTPHNMTTCNWLWSEPHQDHYYVTVDQYSKYHHLWG